VQSQDFQRFFAVRFILGVDVVDNRGAQEDHIRAMLKQKGLLP
jgi:hypothetical protein